MLGDVGLRLRPQPRGGDAGTLPCLWSPGPPPFRGDLWGLSTVAEHHVGGRAALRPGHGPSAGWAARRCRPASAPAPAGGGRPPDSSSGRSGASNEPRGHPGCLPCPAFPSLSPSFFHLKMGETSQAAAPGLPSSPHPPSPPPLSPRSGCSLAPTVGKGTPQPGGDITGVSSLRAGGGGCVCVRAHPCSPSAPRCPVLHSPWPDTPPPFPGSGFLVGLAGICCA